MADARSGEIYDIGYQRYEGERLGRRHAIWAVYTQSLRIILGLGRSGWAKLPFFGILVIVLLPAIAQLAAAALASDGVDLIEHYEFYSVIWPLLAIFCALVAPELVGRDQRTQVLSLYFSRALRREDYVLARYAAFVSSLLFLTLVPQFLMFAGNMSASRDALDYLGERWNDVPAIVASAVLLSGLAAGIGLAIASRLTQRAFATAAIVAFFLLASGIAAAVFEASGPDSGKFALLLSPFHLEEGLTLWIFGAESTVEDHEQLFEADFHGAVYALAAAAIALITLAVVVARYRRIAA